MFIDSTVILRGIIVYVLTSQRSILAHSSSKLVIVYIYSSVKAEQIIEFAERDAREMEKVPVVFLLVNFVERGGLIGPTKPLVDG